MEYHHLATGLRDVLLADPHAFDADKLVALTPELLAKWIPGGVLPQIEERVAHLRAVRWVVGAKGGLKLNL